MEKQFIFFIFSSLVLFASYVRCQDEIENEEDQEENAGISVKAQIKEEDGILVLTSENFDDAINLHETILVEFHAPWCDYCQQLIPEYVKAAKALKEAEHPVALAMVDVTMEEELASRFEVEGYPTLKFFKNGDIYDYDGPRWADGIVSYMKMRADPNWNPPPAAVLTLTQDNFKEFVDECSLCLVEFYAPWCGHCKRLAPAYEKAAQALIEVYSPVLLAKVDATQEQELAKEYDVTGYPKLLVFRNGKSSEYKGPWESDGIVSHMVSLQSDASKLLTSLEELKNFIRKDDVTVIGFFKKTGDPAIEVFMTAADEYRNLISFGHTVLREARIEYRVNPNSVVVFNAERYYTKFERKWHIMEKDGMTSNTIKHFVNSHDVPLVGHYTKSSEPRYANKKPLCLLFYTVDWSFDHREATNLWRVKLAAIAKHYKNITFAVADEDEYLELLIDFNLADSGEEFNIGCFDDKNKRYPMEPIEDYDEEEIREFINKFFKGKLEPVLKSQPAPKRQEGPVKVVVGKTFDDIVLDKTKDVLVEFYAPGCAHCKKLEPEYKKLAKKFQKEKKLVIAKVDGTANETPYNFIKSDFPTLYFAPANDKDNPVQYEGDRSINDISKFIKKHATVAFKKEEL